MTARHLLTALFNAGIAISVVATVLSLGMTLAPGDPAVFSLPELLRRMERFL